MLTREQLPPLPTGTILLGKGDEIRRRNTQSEEAWALGLSSTPECWRQGSCLFNAYHLWYAVKATNKLIPANQALVERYNPDVIFTSIGPNYVIENPEPLPEDMPLPPAGYIVLGWGQHLQNPDSNNPENGYMFYDEDSEWSGPSSMIFPDHEGLFAYPINGPTHQAHMRLAEHYNVRNNINFMSFRPLPENAEPTPEGCVIIGCLREPGFHPDGYMLSGNEWIGPQNWSGPDDGHFFAYPADGPVAASHQQGVVHYQPVLASTPEPQPVTYGVRQWLLSVGGTPVGSRNEMEAVLDGMLSDADHLNLLCNELWKALEYDNPEERVESWIDREPVVMAQIDFHPMAESQGVSIPQIAESSASIADLIIKSTAGVLLRGGLSNHFRYLETGELTINPSDPPTLEQGYEILRRTLEIKETGEKLDNYSAWTLGMLGDQMDRYFGDAFDPSMVMGATGKSYNTYITALGVYRALWSNRRNLSFTHHKEAYYSKLEDPADKDWILDTGDALRLSVAQQRKLISHVRLYGTEALRTEGIADPEQLMERLEVRSVNKNYIFFLRTENKWFSYRGPFEHIPNGADPIINADTRAQLSRDGAPVAMEVWTPAGIEMPYVRGHAAVLDGLRGEALEADAEVLPPATTSRRRRAETQVTRNELAEEPEEEPTI